MVLDMAKELIHEEDLGKDEDTDFLGVSFSSPDYAGHTWGVRSREVHDMYLKLDAQLGELIKTLDRKVGRQNYILYLTADHGASENPNHLRNFGYEVQNYQNADVLTQLNDQIEERLGIQSAVGKIINHHIFLNDWAKESVLPITLIVEGIDPFAHAYSAEQIRTGSDDELIKMLNQGHQSRFSGDIVFTLQPNCIFYGPYGSTHGSGYTYDTHVPLLFYGNGVQKGTSYEPTNVTDVAPTISALLGISFPSGATGTVIEKVIY